MKTQALTLISLLTSLAVTLRLLKHAIVGSFQFINIPLCFVFFSSYYFGFRIASIIGILTFIISDLFLGIGIWSVTNSIIVAILSLCIVCIRKIKSKTYLFVSFYLLSLAYDITSSLILYIIFGINFYTALIFSIIGLFMPIQGGYVIGIGPLTEISTSLITIFMIYGVEKRIKIKEIFLKTPSQINEPKSS